MPTTHLINWKDSNSRNLKYLIEPSTIYPGDSFTISIFDPQQYALLSPYNGLSDKSVATAADSKSELLNLNTQSEFPIAKLNGVVSCLPVINADNRTISAAAGENLAAKVAVVDSQLSWNLGFAKGYGSVNVDYQTYPAQIWTHHGLEKSGQAVLFAQNLNTLEYVDIPLTIAERNNANSETLEIVAVAAESHFGWSGVYARLNVLPAALNPHVFTNLGRVEKKGNVRHKVSEKISLDGSGVIKTKYPPLKLIQQIGIFYDSKNNPKNCYPFISGSGLICEKGIYGDLTVEYETWAVQYDYFPEITGDLLTGFKEEIGLVMAVKDKNSAVFEVPPPSLSTAQKQEVLTVYFEKAVCEDGEFELPPNIKANPPNSIYPSHPYISLAALMKTWNFVTEKVIAEKVLFDGTFFSTEAGIINNLKPFDFGSANKDRVYHIEKKIPSGFTDSQIAEINKAEVELKKKWGVQ